MADHDRDGGGSRGRLVTPEWNPELHATYCPQHNPPPADGGGSSWLCCCTYPYPSRGERQAALADKRWNQRHEVYAKVAAEDRAAEVRLYGEKHVARLEAEANK